MIVGLPLITNFKANQTPELENMSTVCDVSEAEANVPLWRIVFSHKFMSIYVMYVLHFIYIIYFISVYKEFGQ